MPFITEWLQQEDGVDNPLILYPAPFVMVRNLSAANAESGFRKLPLSYEQTVAALSTGRITLAHAL